MLYVRCDGNLTYANSGVTAGAVMCDNWVQVPIGTLLEDVKQEMVFSQGDFYSISAAIVGFLLIGLSVKLIRRVFNV